MSSEKRVNNHHEDSSSSGQAMPVTNPPPPPLPLNCPRCNSNNTKFCYYNNYNSRQPRHFCRACKRYWTQGGTLRNIPIGSGNRKSKTSTRSSSLRVSSGDSKESSGDSSYSAIDRSKYFDRQELHDQLGHLSIYPTVHSVSANLSVPVVGGQLVSALGNIPTPPIASTAVTDQRLDQLGDQIEGLLPEFGPTNFASSIMSMSPINQDFSWNVEQLEGLDMMYMNGGDSINFDQQQDDMIGATNHLVGTQQPQPTLLQSSEMPPNYDPINVNAGDVNAAHLASTDPWYYGGSAGYDAPVLDQVPSSNGSGNGSQAWTNFGHYPTMP